MSYDASESTLEARIDRLESLDEIRQLAAKYSLSLDMRDLDAHVNLFAPDIRVSRDKIGRRHLKRWLDDTLRQQFTGTSHHIGNHIIEFNDFNHSCIETGAQSSSPVPGTAVLARGCLLIPGHER